jgi:hypothetical protein
MQCKQAAVLRRQLSKIQLTSTATSSILRPNWTQTGELSVVGTTDSFDQVIAKLQATLDNEKIWESKDNMSLEKAVLGSSGTKNA